MRVTISQRRYRYIDALRGYAILGVMAVHTGQHIENLPPILKTVTWSGIYGVQLFFVVSALTLSLSWNARNDGAARFYIRRLFRIAPMFWLAACGYLAIFGMAPRYWAPAGLTAQDVTATFLFLNGWTLNMNGLVPGGWSISAEVMFYVLFPFLVAYITSLRRAVIAFLAAVAIYDLAMRLLPTDNYLSADFVQWWPVAQAPVFLIGFIVYYATRVELPKWVWLLGIQASIAALLFLSL